MAYGRHPGAVASVARLCAVACLLLAPALLAQDSTTPPTNPKCKPGSKLPACVNATNGTPAPPTSQQFPFPTEDSQHGGDAQPGAPSAPPATPGTPAPASNGLPGLPTGGDVPDPPASSQKPMRMPPSGIGGVPDDSAPSSSSSSSSDSGSPSSSHHDDDDADVAPTTAAPNAPVKAMPLKDLGSHGDMSAARAKLEATRVADDLKVGQFYFNDGNLQGAYLRFKDAVEHDPEDPDARFKLAQVLEKMKKRDEAVASYQECLKLDPGGDHDKAARRALQDLGAKP